MCVRTPTALITLVAVGLLAAVPASAGAAAKNLWLKKRVMNIAHQGGEDEFPSNTLYAFRRAVAAGADMLELDVGVTKDHKVVVMHDTTVDRTTNGHGTIASKTLRQMEKLDGAYWFHRGGNAYVHGLSKKSYKFRGIATKKRKPPKGFKASDFRVPTLSAVMKAFPHTPINVEIKGRTKTEAISEYLTNAKVLAKLLKPVKRKDIIVVSFKQPAVDLFHQLAPKVPLAPGVDGDANFLLGGKSPGPGVVAFQVPITYVLNGQKLTVTTPELVAKAHKAGYAWQNWFGDDDKDAPATWKMLIDDCVDGIMTSQPVALERVLKTHPKPASCSG